MTEAPKVEECNCALRKKIVINITQVLDEAECGVSDLDLGPVLDWDLNGPKGQPVLRIRFCPWCGKRAPKPERITDFTVEEREEDEDWRGTSGG